METTVVLLIVMCMLAGSWGLPITATFCGIFAVLSGLTVLMLKGRY